ncbi:MAG: nucleotidyltransferase family protein, partial [Pseudomonadota bacterium]
APGFWGAILAAGSGVRFGGGKLLAPLAGRPLIAWPVDAALASGLERILVVAGADLAAIRSALPADPRLSCIANPDHARGMGATLALAAGRAMAGRAAGLVVILGDTPLIAPETIAAVSLAAAQAPAGAAAAAVGGRRCHPVAFMARHLPRLAGLGGDSGGRELLAELGDGLALTPAPDHSGLDVDTPADLDRAAALLMSRGRPA